MKEMDDDREKEKAFNGLTQFYLSAVELIRNPQSSSPWNEKKSCVKLLKLSLLEWWYMEIGKALGKQGEALEAKIRNIRRDYLRILWITIMLIATSWKKVVSVGSEKTSSPVYCVLANFPILARSFKAVNTKLSGVNRYITNEKLFHKREIFE